MTIPNSNYKNTYVGNGVTTTFAYGFKILQATDLKVVQADLDGVETTLSPASITGVGETAGGNVVLSAPLASGYKLAVFRDPSDDQTVDLRNQGALFRDVVEDALDQRTMVSLKQQEELDRSIKVPVTDSGVTLELPAAAQRALKTLAFDADGNVIAGEAPTGGIVSLAMTPVVQASTLALAGDIFKVTASGSPEGRSLSARFSDVVNVKDFGAEGDGVTDDTSAIQLALGNVFDGSAPAKTVFFPIGTYLISSTLEVPPNCVLIGAGRFSTNTTGSLIKQSHNGVGVRFVRRNAMPGSLYHKGGVIRMAFTTTAGGGSSTKLIELGDSSSVTTSVGCWNVFIRDCTLRYATTGYGIYSAHSQEAIIDGNFIDAVKFPIYYNTVVASCRITNNTLLDESAISGAVGVFMRPGSLGGAVGCDITGNYIIGFDNGMHLTSIGGAHIVGNAFEACRKDALHLTEYLLDEVTADGTGCFSCNIDGNTFINWAASAAGYCAIKLDYSRNNFVGRQCYQSPNGAAASCVGYYDGGTADKAQDNIIVWPIVTGINTSVLPLPTNSVITAQNKIIGSQYEQEQSLSADPSTSGWGAGEQGRRWYNHSSLQWKRWINGAGVVVDYDVASGGPIHRGYAKASLPSASQAGKIIFVSDEVGGATIAFSDGTNWRRVSDRAIVS